MSVFLELANSTYAGYKILLSRISYISMINYNNKLKEFYLELGYDSKEFSKFVLSFPTEEEASQRQQEIINILEEFYSR
ncbi:MAG: hypothetical protein JXB60_06045 [Candidatus Cloacimonetes bacterium]|nr:hypothetical protein [Candidatus Cloacimonadota bacterium]